MSHPPIPISSYKWARFNYIIPDYCGSLCVFSGRTLSALYMMEPGLWFPVGSRYRDGRAGANGGVKREHAASGSTSAGILTPAYIVGWREPGPHEHLDSVEVGVCLSQECIWSCRSLYKSGSCDISPPTGDIGVTPGSSRHVPWVVVVSWTCKQQVHIRVSVALHNSRRALFWVWGS